MCIWKILQHFADSITSPQEIYKEFSCFVAAAKVNVSRRFLQFRKMETTLGFLTFPDQAKVEDLSCILHCLNIENLEMELLEFQEYSILNSTNSMTCVKLFQR